MTTPNSTHIPEFSGAIVSVTGSLVVDTGLRDVQSFSVGLAEVATATETTAQGALLPQVAGATRKMTITVKAENGSTAGGTAAKIAWMAIGK